MYTPLEIRCRKCGLLEEDCICWCWTLRDNHKADALSNPKGEGGR